LMMIMHSYFNRMRIVLFHYDMSLKMLVLFLLSSVMVWCFTSICCLYIHRVYEGWNFGIEFLLSNRFILKRSDRPWLRLMCCILCIQVYYVVIINSWLIWIFGMLPRLSWLIIKVKSFLGFTSRVYTKD